MGKAWNSLQNKRFWGCLGVNPLKIEENGDEPHGNDPKTPRNRLQTCQRDTGFNSSAEKGRENLKQGVKTALAAAGRAMVALTGPSRGAPSRPWPPAALTAPGGAVQRAFSTAGVKRGR